MNSFFDVGRTIECGHCHPDKYSLPTLKCECICHDKETQGWKLLIEKLADIEHQRWSSWYKWQRDKSNFENIGRWNTQADTPYFFLSEIDKDKDREQVRRYLPFLESYIAQVTKEEYVKGYADGIKHHTQNI